MPIVITINTYITKDRIRDTVKKIFDISLDHFSNFMDYENWCIFKDNEYVCLYQDGEYPHSKIEFVKAYEYDSTLDILVKYQYIENGIGYKDFHKNEVGEEYYKVTFEKIDGEYYYDSSMKVPLEN